jgi:S1-C subfamily serine protease
MRYIAQLSVSLETLQPSRPWIRLQQEMLSGGTAIVIQNHRLLTCAHIVIHAKEIHVVQTNCARKYLAQIEHISIDSDLAILTVSDSDFFDSTVPTSLYEHSVEAGSEAEVHAFTSEATRPTITPATVVSCEPTTFAISGRFLRAMRLDAELGNVGSGGAVLIDNKLAGIVFQEEKEDGVSAAYAIPVSLINQFLADIGDDIVSGTPELGICWQKTTDRSLREYLDIADHQLGVLISKVIKFSSADGVLLENDVLMKIEGFDVDRDGLLKSTEMAMHFHELVSLRQVGSQVAIEALRSGQRHSFQITLKPYVGLVQSDYRARYVVVGGIVMVPLTYEYLLDSGGVFKSLFRYRNYYFDETPSDTQREIVIIDSIVPHAINRSYQGMYNVRVLYVNGIRITRLADVITGLRSRTGRFHILELENAGIRNESCTLDRGYGNLVVLDAEAVERATSDILNTIGLQSWHSKTL